MKLARVRLRVTYANVTATIALVVALSAGSATAARHITGTDIRNGTITGRDVRNGSLGAAELTANARTQLTDTSAWETIPSGQTVTGSFGTRYRAPAATIGQSIFMHLPARPRARLIDGNIAFSAESGPVAIDTDAACTGSTDAPTAPRGKICVYLLSSNNVSGLVAGAWLETGPSTQGAWYIQWLDTAADATTELRGIWAYTAP
jgi:hypothetical protein